MKIPVMTFMLFIISVGSFSQTKWDSLKTPPHKDIQQMVNINDDIYAVTGKGYILWYKISENEWIQKAKLPVTGYIRMVYYSESLYLFCENGQVYNYKIETDLLTQLNSEKFIEKYFPMMLRAGYSEKYIPLIINDSIYICTGMQDNSDGMRYIYDDSIYVVKYNNDGKPGNEILIEKQRQEYIQALSDGKYLYIVGHKNMVSQYLSITVYSLPDFKEIKEMAGPLRLTGKTVDGAIKFALSDGKFYASRSAELMHYSESLEIWSNIISYPQLISSTIAMTVNNGIIYAAFYNDSFKSYKVATRPSPFSFEDPNISLLPSNSKYLMLTGQAIADVDNNGYKDIVSLYHLEGICIDLYKNTGGKFSTAVCLYENNEFVFGQNCNVKIGDMNNDGHDDIVLGVGDYTSSDSDEQPNVPEIFIGDGKGNFTPRNIEGLHIPVEFSLADINNDGVLEIISPGNGGSVVRLDPDLKSFRKQLCNIPFSSGTLKTCDLNNDGFTDALLMRSLNNPVLAYSIGNGIFRAEAKTLNDSYTKALIADFNNDNVLDGLLSSSYDPPVTDYNPSRLILSVSSDISTGGLFKTVKNIYTPTGEVEAAAAADLDFDGLIDIVGAFGGFFLNTAVESSALLFRNTGSDNYMAVDRLSFNPDFGKEIWYNIPLKMDICDLNNDRKPDLIFGAYSGIPQTNQRLNKILFNGEKGIDVNISEKPSGLLATSAGDDVKLTWNHIKQPFYTYEIRLEKKDGSAWVARRGNASDILKINSAWFYSLKPGRYGASIRVLSNSFNNSEWSDEYEFYITETDQIKPNPVTFMRAASYLPYNSLKKTLAGNSGSGVKLNWRIPDNPDFQGVTIVRRNDRYPLSPQDGRIVYNGLDETYLDTSGIAADMYKRVV